MATDYSLNRDLFKLLEEGAEEAPKEAPQKHNYCPNCNVPYAYSQLSSSMYECLQCGSLKELKGLANGENETNGEVHSGAARYVIGGRHNVYNGGHTDYKRTQRRAIMEQLIALNIDSEGLKLTMDIIERVVFIYNTLQQEEVSIEIVESGGARVAKKKFIKRNTVKDEVLASIIFAECDRARYPVTKRLVAQFMKLTRCGFARGDKIFEDMMGASPEAQRDEDQVTRDMINKYLGALGIDVMGAIDFVGEIIGRADELYVGHKSTRISKVVGTIWLFCRHLGLPLNAEVLERRCDGIKRATFEKFYMAIEVNLWSFRDIFERYKVPCASARGLK